MSLPASQKGFTLIELVAVIVILGVLASVAIPKYMDITRESQNRAALQAVAEGKARLSINYARIFLDTGMPPDAVNLVNAVGASTGIGDYDMTLSVVDTLTIKINVTGKQGIPGANSGLWKLPN